MSDVESKLKRARDLQKDFIARTVKNDEDFFIVDWSSPKMENLATRYILDIKNGALMINGDSGSCIAMWYNHIAPKDLKSCMCDEYYFISKIRTSTNIYSYSKEDVEEDITDMEDNFINTFLGDNESREESTRYLAEEVLDIPYSKGMTVQQLVHDEFEPVRDYFENACLTDNTEYPEEVCDVFSKFDANWKNDGGDHIGRRPSNRIYLWLTGYQMLCEQLGI